MITRLEIGPRPDRVDPRGKEVAHRVRSCLGLETGHVRTCEVYHVQGDLRPGESERILTEFVDPVQQRGALGRLRHERFDIAVTVGYKPGVTDPVGKSALVAVEDTLGRSLGPEAAVYCSRLYLLQGVDRRDAERIAVELLANPVIQTVRLDDLEEWTGSPPDLSVPRVEPRTAPRAETVDMNGDPAFLLKMSRERLLALSLKEMQAIREHFEHAALSPARKTAGLGARPTDVELECLAQTWSEHCQHKIFNATIRYREEGRPEETIRSLFGTYIKGATEAVDRAVREREGRSWLVSVFHDNAGVVAFDASDHLVFKVETHNTPSALDPYGGAITGIVGVNRDPFGTGLGADLLVNVWGYCFGSPFYQGELPRGLLHPRRVRDGVHEGVIDGGNQSGIPYGRGWEVFDDRYLGKPLVFCGTVGRLPVKIAGRPGEEKAARPGDRVVMTGGRIGADGIHGATFSSAVLDESAPVQAVQIGDPITQKRMFDFLLEARTEGLYEAITDNGAGGLSSSVGEMAEASGGVLLDLSRAPLKYAGLAPWEILVSEAQERMTLAVPPEKVERLLEFARLREVEATDLGEFTDSGYLHVTHGNETVAHISMEFLHGGTPLMVLDAEWSEPRFDEPAETQADDWGSTLIHVLRRLNVGSGEGKARHYDHEVKGLTVVKPFVGVEADVPAEATVFLARHGSWRGFCLSEGVNPFFSDIDAHAMAEAVVDLAVRRQVCAGARGDRIAALDNFCWPDPVASAQTPDGAYKLAQLVRACRGLYDATRDYGTPLISGKDSMKNDSTMGGVKISVPPTLLVSAIGQLDDVRRAVTLDPKAPGDVLFLIGTTRDETGGSEYYRHLGQLQGVTKPLGSPRPFVGNKVPRLDTAETLPLYRALEQAIGRGLVRSAATPAMGGLAVTLARCAIAARLGLEVDLDACPDLAALPRESALFSESLGRFVVTTSPEDADEFEAAFAGLACRRIGLVTGDPRLTVRSGRNSTIDTELSDLVRAFKETLSDD
jgi:phosphoribosylformylglycinamidine synthase II